MQVTIIVDASHCPKYNVAGYGFWIASQRGKLPGSGKMKSLVKTSTIAEMQAVVNSVWAGIKYEFIQDGDEILIQTDCEAAIFAFNQRRRMSSEELDIVKRYLQLKSKLNLSCTFRHVRAHTNNPNRRSKAQAHCDIGARRAMRKARIQLQINEALEVLK